MDGKHIKLWVVLSWEEGTLWLPNSVYCLCVVAVFWVRCGSAAAGWSRDNAFSVCDFGVSLLPGMLRVQGMGSGQVVATANEVQAMW